jgi:hypothetical protein
VAPTCALLAVVALGVACQKPAPPPAPKPAAAPVLRRPTSTLFDHSLVPDLPARPRQDCSPEALMAVARHVGEMENIAVLPFTKPRAKGKLHQETQCPTPEAALVAAEAKGPLPERVSACMSQDGPYDAEWDMVNSAVISLAVCLDCARPKDDRMARCQRVADVVKRAEQTVKSRLGK